MSLSITNLQKICLISSLLTILSSSNIFESSVEAKPLLVFDCSPDPKTGIYYTIIKYSSGNSKELIRWKSNIVGNPKKVCHQVTERFQQSWESGKLNYLKTARSNKTGRAMICGLADDNSPCDDNTKLFDLLPSTTPKTAVRSLLQNIANITNTPIQQSSDDEIIVDLKASIEQLISH
jgi:Circadian oscillating protein COP23